MFCGFLRQIYNQYPKALKYWRENAFSGAMTNHNDASVIERDNFRLLPNLVASIIQRTNSDSPEQTLVTIIQKIQKIRDLSEVSMTKPSQEQEN